jgi:hypothetical protein
MDETGCSEFVDSCEMTVLVPDEYTSSEIFIPIDRHSKRLTLTGCIRAVGKVLKPYVIIDRVTVDDQLILSGYGPSTAEFVTQKNAFMTMVLFDKWAQDIFFPAVREKRPAYRRYSGKAVLIMDGFGAHSTVGFMEECKKQNVRVKFLVHHTSDRCQPLNSVVFASLKSQYARKRVEISTSAQTNRIVRMMRAWWAATAPDIIVSSFKAVGIIPFFEKGSQEVQCRIDLKLSLKLKDLAPVPIAANKSDPKRTQVRLARIDHHLLSSDEDSDSTTKQIFSF